MLQMALRIDTDAPFEKTPLENLKGLAQFAQRAAQISSKYG